MIVKAKNRKLAIILAFAGAVAPVSGLHKFYLGQYGWGILYLLLSWTPIPRVASAIEGVWYLSQHPDEFDLTMNPNLAPQTPVEPPVDPKQVGAIADSLRHLDQLRQDGLISDYEFEQKRRQLLDRIA
ncbi:MAG: NINE protein [Synechococcales cyanobacterium K44_A2020_017]|nr:NINE protein [Synechococcales cyanobacterium K32_A2020_035]MBF2094284.1 NINE protein [Synechococcales cyanobacterium K44_A2020_017]